MLRVNIKKKLSKFQLDVKFETDNEVLGLLGMSGSGKSMTLKCIAGIEKPDEGQIILNGRVLFDSEKKINMRPQDRNIGYLFQDYALFPNMTVYENICVGISKDANRKEKVENILREMNLLDKIDHYPNYISGGEAQRVALARIIVTEPDVLLLDEPFSALDEFLSWKIEMDMAETIEQHVRNAILVSHDKEEVYRMTDTVCVLHEGVSEGKVNTKELFENPNTYASGMLSGIKNFTKYKKMGEGIYLEEYGIELSIDEELCECGLMGIKSCGLQLHREEVIGENVFQCVVTKVVEGIDNIIYLLMFSQGENKGRLVVEEVRHESLGILVGEVVYLNISSTNIVIMESDVDIYYEF